MAAGVPPASRACGARDAGASRQRPDVSAARGRRGGHEESSEPSAAAQSRPRCRRVGAGAEPPARRRALGEIPAAGGGDSGNVCPHGKLIPDAARAALPARSGSGTWSGGLGTGRRARASPASSTRARPAVALSRRRLLASSAPGDPLRWRCGATATSGQGARAPGHPGGAAGGGSARAPRGSAPGLRWLLRGRPHLACCGSSGGIPPVRPVRGRGGGRRFAGLRGGSVAPAPLCPRRARRSRRAGLGAGRLDPAVRRAAVRGAPRWVGHPCSASLASGSTVMLAWVPSSLEPPRCGGRRFCGDPWNSCGAAGGGSRGSAVTRRPGFAAPHGRSTPVPAATVRRKHRVRGAVAGLVGRGGGGSGCRGGRGGCRARCWRSRRYDVWPLAVGRGRRARLAHPGPERAARGLRSAWSSAPRSSSRC